MRGESGAQEANSKGIPPVGEAVHVHRSESQGLFKCCSEIRMGLWASLVAQ